MNEEIADTTLIKNKFNSEDDAVLHAKIKNITLGYTFPNKLCKRLGIEKCRIYGTAYNVFVLPFKSELKHTDPENNGSDTFPLYKTYLLGLNVSF